VCGAPPVPPRSLATLGMTGLLAMWQRVDVVWWFGTPFFSRIAALSAVMTAGVALAITPPAGRRAVVAGRAGRQLLYPLI